MSTPLDRLKALADLTGLRQNDLTVLSPQHDPFAVGTPNDVALADWFAEAVAKLPAKSRHLRKTHYDLLVANVLTPAGHVYGERPEADWRLLQAASRTARVLGTADPFANVDRRTKPVATHDVLRDGFDPGAEISEPSLWVPYMTPLFSYPEVSVLLPDRLRLQPLTVEIVAEKSSVLDPDEPHGAAIEALVRRFGVRVSETTGYAARGLGESIVRRTLADGRPRVVLWLSDADSAGESMAPAASRYIEFLYSTLADCPRILLDRVALTLDQVREIEAEIGREIPLAPDVRREEGRVELEAILSLAPGWIEREVERRVNEVYDEIPDYDFEAEAAKEAVEEAWAEHVAEHAAEEMEAARRIEHQLRNYLAGNEAVDPAKLAEYEQEANDAAKALDQAHKSFAAQVEFDPEVEVDLDWRDWLLDTEREYVEQLNAYIRHAPIHKRRDEVALLERRCALADCPRGGSMAGRSVRARFCSDSCAQQAKYHRARARQAANADEDEEQLA